MSLKYLNLSGLEDLWINIKNYILSKVPTKTSELTNDSGYLTSHQSLSNYVTLNTAQEITSAKTFKSITARKLTSVEAGNVIPSSDKLISDIWQDKNGKELGRIYYVKSKSGTTGLIMRAGDWFTSNEGVYTLDASGTNRRAELHLYTDSSGNCCIKPVGLFSTHIKPLDSSVYLGEYGKPFGIAYVNQVRFINATLQVDVDIAATEEHSIGFFGKKNGPLSYITFQKRPSFKDRVAIRIQTASNSYKSYDFDATCFYPESSNSVDIGSTTNIFKNIYCNNYYKGTTAFGDIVTHNASEFLTQHQSLANYATKQDLADLVNSAPSALDTLNELASALGNDPNFATTVSTQIGTKANDNVVVHKSGNEIVAGFKQFDNIRVNNSIKAINLDSTTTDLNNCYSDFAPYNENKGGNIQYYYCSTDAGTANITNLPEAKAFVLTSITTRLISNSLYVKQILINSNSKTFVRYCNNSTWSTWVNETDSEYVHKSRDETISGNKTFSSNVNVYNSDSATDTANIVLKNSKAERGSTTNIDEQTIFFLDKDNAQLGQIICNVDSNGYSNISIQCSDLNNVSAGVQVRKTLGGVVFRPTNDNQCWLGHFGRRWYNTYTSKINNLEPSSLSLPSGNLTEHIDISSYFANTGTGEENSYTASANGWIYLRLGSISSCQAGIYDVNSNRMWGQSTTGSVEQITIPILKGQTLTTQWATSTTVNVAIARFIPCQGNV